MLKLQVGNPGSIAPIAAPFHKTSPDAVFISKLSNYDGCKDGLGHEKEPKKIA